MTRPPAVPRPEGLESLADHARVHFLEVGRTGRESCLRLQPTRTCVGCRKRAAKGDLLRVVVGATATEDDQSARIVPDPGATRPGRGAYLHPTGKCLELAERRRAFGRALRVTSPVELTDVRGYLERNTEQMNTGSGSSGS